MQLTARLTGDAKISTLNDDRQVINFTVAHNEFFKAKGQEKAQQVTEYIRCAYWRSSKMAEYLTKGTLIEMDGRIGLNVYNNSEGQARGNLTFHVNRIKLHGGKKAGKPATSPTQPSTTGDDDLPF